VLRSAESGGVLERLHSASARNGFGLSTAETDERAKIIEAELRFLPDGERVHVEWRRLVVRYSVAGDAGA